VEQRRVMTVIVRKKYFQLVTLSRQSEFVECS
jgi:hypothetical protein